MKCVRTDLADRLSIAIDGHLDALTARDVRPIFDQVVADNPKKVSVDIENLTMLDSSGVGAIVSLFKRVKANGGTVTVVGAKDQPLAVLKLLKLDRLFGVPA